MRGLRRARRGPPWRSLSLLIVALAGCPGDDDPYRDAPRTAAGYRVVWEDLGSGVAWKEVAARVDRSLPEAARSLNERYGVDVAAILALPHELRIVFHVFDHVEWGNWRGRYSAHRLDVMYWTHSTSVGRPIDAPEGAPREAPAWTVMPSRTLYPGQWSYGLLDDADFAALLAHELGHALFGPGFEH